MSFPNIPDIKPTVSIDRDNAVDLLLASVAFEELGLAHIINAEAEKIQYAVGTLPERRPAVPATIAQILAVNRSAVETLRGVIKNEMLLTFKLEDIMELASVRVYKNTAVAAAMFEGETVSASDAAYYHTRGGGAA